MRPIAVVQKPSAGTNLMAITTTRSLRRTKNGSYFLTRPINCTWWMRSNSSIEVRTNQKLKASAA